jgi:colicin import membrane protein
VSSDSVYAKPVAPRIVLRPALATLALHGFMLYALTVNWSGTEERVIKVKPAPKVINARLVDVSEFRPRPKPKPKAVSKPRSKPKPKPKAVSKPRSKPRTVAAKPKPKVQPKPVVKKTPAPAKPKPKVEPEPRITEEELAAITRADLARAVEEEQQFEAAVTADEMTASFSSLIQQAVVNYWSRPPSARNGMEALLEIQLIPTGEVVNVRVLKSSGNAAFDRSAMNAVQKAGSFPELQQLPGREFEKNFRRFHLKFRPEDLRY